MVSLVLRPQQRLPSLAIAIVAIVVSVSDAKAMTWNGTISGTAEAILSNGHAGFFVLFSGKATGNTPACAANEAHRFVIDPTTDGGKSEIAIAISAWSTQSNITIVGVSDAKNPDGSPLFTPSQYCNVWGDTENIWYMQVGG